MSSLKFSDTFPPLPKDKFQVIYADPPWSMHNRKALMGWSPEQHYECVDFETLAKLPVNEVCDDRVMLACWVIQSRMPLCIEVCESWGFEYSTIGWCWDKQRTQLGYYTAPSIELCLLFKHKQGGLRNTGLRVSQKEKQMIRSPRREHSRKPDEVRESIERLWPDAKRLELFARECHDGWTVWGNQSEKYNNVVRQERLLL